MASSSGERHSGSPMEANAPAVPPMDAKLMVATGRGDCQQLKDVVNKEDAGMMVVVMASSNTRPSVSAAASPPVAMHPLLHASASSGDWKGLTFLLNREESQADPTNKPSQEFLKSLQACTSGGNCTNGRLPTPPQASNDIEEGANMPLLLSPESLLEGVTIEGDTALHVVATHGDGHNFLKCVDTICAKGKHLMFKQNNKGDTPLHCAARAGNHEMVDKLIGLAIGPSRREESVDKIENDLHRSENLSTETPLNDVGRMGVEYLRMENDSKETALHEAIRIGHSPLVKKLLAYDSELARFPQEGTSPLYLSILLEQFDIAQTLYDQSKQHILSYSGPTGQNALHVAVLRSTEMTKVLLEWNKNLTMQGDKNGSTPLHFASSRTILSNHGVYPHPCISCFRVPFPRFKVLTEVLEDNGAPLYQPDNVGMFPIHVAAAVGEKQTIKLFVKRYPSSAGLRDKQGRTFLHVAVEKKKENVVRYACGNRSLAWILNMQDNNGNTALHLAVEAKNHSMFCSLFQNRQVQLNLVNVKGQTARDISVNKIPAILHYNQGTANNIFYALTLTGAMNGTCRWDHFLKNYKDIHQVAIDGKRTDLKNMTEATQTMVVGAVLIATVTFGVTFAVPGGYIADDHPHGGTPTLAGRYAFDAFMVANTFAFVCSTIATVGLMYSGSPMFNHKSRTFYISTAFYFMRTSITCMIVAFTLGVHMVLAPVAPRTSFVVCVISPLVVVWCKMKYWLKWLALAPSLCVRAGYIFTLGLLFPFIIVSSTIFEYWPVIFTFTWAAFGRRATHL
uniref:PGG domain-containing protein n=1 Tax=Oryza barthii TaxID=65489 RepID=A0A0D3H5D4_9ORYZ